MNSYQTSNGALAYINFLNSPAGQAQQHILTQAILQHLPKTFSPLLDAGCGTGWLCQNLLQALPGLNISACDNAPLLLQTARTALPHINFDQASLEKTLPYPANHFQTIVANMVLHDLPNLAAGLKNLEHILHPDGTLIATLPNPYYAYPVGVWKRGIGKLWGKLPRLRLKPGSYFLATHKKTAWNPFIHSYWYSLPHYLSAAKQAGLYLEHLSDIHAAKDSQHFNLYYQLHRFPLLWVLRFKKCRQ